jgi:hypothetical protein
MTRACDLTLTQTLSPHLSSRAHTADYGSAGYGAGYSAPGQVYTEHTTVTTYTPAAFFWQSSLHIHTASSHWLALVCSSKIDD